MGEFETGLERRLRRVEDHLAIMNLIARHALAADTGSPEHAGELFAGDGQFDRGSAFEVATGPVAIGAVVGDGEHASAISLGLAHLHGLPHIVVSNDTASATSYLQILVPDRVASERVVPNHGASRGYWIHRVAANRWEFVRTEEGWRIKSRRLRAIDGSSEALELLRQGLAAEPMPGIRPGSSLPG